MIFTVEGIGLINLEEDPLSFSYERRLDSNFGLSYNTTVQSTRLEGELCALFVKVGLPPFPSRSCHSTQLDQHFRNV